MPTVRKITQIKLSDYRAFYGDYEIHLPGGENLLIYGENGSGKSSLYRGLKDFFEQEVGEEAYHDAELKPNIFAEYEPAIHLDFADFENGQKREAGTFANLDFDSEDIDGEENVPSRAFIFDANLAKGFFSYREILATHLDDKGASKFNLFNVLINNVLHNYVEPGTGTPLLELWTDLIFDWEEYVNDVFEFPQPDRERKRMLDEAKANIETKLEQFYLRLEATLQLLELDVNDLNKYFDHNLELEFQSEKPVLDTQSAALASPVVFLVVRYFGHEIPEHHFFLNEARLSALAISIFLASILNNPTKDVCKVLFLDDIFIGLDTGNRIPLLHILNDKFSEFQIFLSTYDREWFEIARNHLRGNWKTLEMYVDRVQQQQDQEGGEWEDYDELDENLPEERKREFEKPLLFEALPMQPTEDDYYDRALAYFSIKDYPASANYLRKCLERFLKVFLPARYSLIANDNGTVNEIEKLETLLDNFKKLCQAFPAHFDYAQLQKKIELYKRTVFNPLSHDDIKSPIYRRELDEAIDLIGELLDFKNTLVLRKGEILHFEETDTNGRRYKCKLKLESDLRFLQQPGKPGMFWDCSVKGITYTLNDGNENTYKTFDTLSAEQKSLFVFLKRKNDCIPANCYRDFKYLKNSQLITLEQLKDEIISNNY